MKPNLLIVEDDAALSELLVWQFENAGYQVEHTPDGDEALLLAKENAPDVIILDWMIEQVPGIEVCRRLRRANETAQIPIIMLTARSAEEDRIRGLETGADDYVTKPFSPRELVARVQALLRRAKPAATGQSLSFDGVELDPVAHRVTSGGMPVDMGPTEFRLLRYFLERPRRVLSRAQLIDGVWSRDAEIDERTVDVHVGRLRKALKAGAAGDPIRTVRSEGYSLDRK
jgi:two-component system, OmpR family, phosphate regulon response regulator PhoB